MKLVKEYLREKERGDMKRKSCEKECDSREGEKIMNVKEIERYIYTGRERAFDVRKRREGVI